MKVIMATIILASSISCTTIRPIAATSERVGTAKGKACASNVLGIIPLSTDASIYKAARSGGVKKIATVDFERFYSFVYNKACTVVRGNR